jgi:C-terminal processing protease CtpA/Prc
LPPGFQVRLGTRPLDNFVTGTYRAGGRNIGYIRIPRMTSTSSLAAAYRELETEIEFFQQNTDGMVVDIMRNLGGLLSYGHQLARRFVPAPFEGVGFEVRASATYVSEFSNELERAKQLGAPEHVVRTWTALLNGVYETYKENRGRTGVLPLDGHESLTFTPATSASGANLAYTKPLILLIDEYTCSTADLFAAVLQDAGRGPLVGMRTAGCGGSYGNHQFVPATVYSEGQTGVTQALMVRPKAIATPEFPTTRYIENVGVRPDIELDYMTRENLTQRGRPFLEAVTQLILDRIEAH